MRTASDRDESDIQRKAWFDKLTTNGISDKLTTNGISDKLTTNGISDKLTTNGISDGLTTNGFEIYALRDSNHSMERASALA